MFLQKIIQFHNQIFYWMHSLTQIHPEYNHFVYIIAEKIDNYVILFAILTLLFFVYRSLTGHRKKRFILLVSEMAEILSSVVLAWGVSYLIKISMALPRPVLRLHGGVHPLFAYGGFDSFPSGHATLFMALGVMIYLYHKKIGSLFIFFALIIALARVIGGVHFPIDILVGWIIGGGVSLLVYRFFKKIKISLFVQKIFYLKK